MKFEIYCNHGVLGAEKRNVWTYNVEHSRGVCSEKFIVRLPENDSFKIYESATGELMVESSWGWQYTINEVLNGEEKPCFYALDKHKAAHRVYLEIVEE